MMMRVKNHHTPPTIRPDNDLKDRKEGGRRIAQEQIGWIMARTGRMKIRGKESCKKVEQENDNWRSN